MDFGTGALGDMACHTCNLPFRAFGPGYPTEVEAETVDLTKDCYPIKSQIRFQFPQREGLVPVTFRWYDVNRTDEMKSVPYSDSKGLYHDGDNKPPKDVLADVVDFLGAAPGAAA